MLPSLRLALLERECEMDSTITDLYINVFPHRIKTWQSSSCPPTHSLHNSELVDASSGPLLEQIVVAWFVCPCESEGCDVWSLVLLVGSPMAEWSQMRDQTKNVSPRPYEETE